MSGLDNIRLSSEAKVKLSTLKSRTGIRQWNILCRWAFCVSLAEDNPPSSKNITTDSNVEMSWRTFTGAGNEGLYMALLKARCIRDNLPINDDNLSLQFRLHLHRGISYLSSPGVIRNLFDLLKLASLESDHQEANQFRGLIS